MTIILFCQFFLLFKKYSSLGGTLHIIMNSVVRENGHDTVIGFATIIFVARVQ